MIATFDVAQFNSVAKVMGALTPVSAAAMAYYKLPVRF
jgi:hypothetical protein